MAARVKAASFSRLGYSGSEVFAEVETAVEGVDATLVAVFKKSEGGVFELVGVAEKRADYDLDWYDNNLHEAYPSVTKKLFGDGPGGAAARKAFAEQVLGMPGVRDAIEDALFYRA